MTCFFPHIGYYAREKNPKTGKRPIVWNKQRNPVYSDTPVRVPCGKCIGCLQSRALQWAVRITHEVRMSGVSAFVTLTYSPVNLPVNASLVKSDLQKFMKRLRKVRPAGLRFFACGEYGETLGRPHYHVLLLNTDFPDKRYYKNSAVGHPLYVSAEVGQLWPFGDHYIGEVTAASAKYVAGYVAKKLGSEQLAGREPEFQVMSRRPGLGFSYLEKYGQEGYRHDNCIVDGRPVPLPRYYDTKYEDVVRVEELKRKRRDQQLTPAARANNTHQRRLVRERLEHLKLQRFKRDPT